jgi:manganese transport protein
MAPAFIIVGCCMDATDALVLSQVVLSLTLPGPLIALLIMTGKEEVMGAFANRGITCVVAGAAAVAIVVLNILLVLQTGIPLPAL